MNLADLIRTTKGDRTYEQLSHDCGGEPTSQRLQQIAAGKPVREFLKVPTMRALAAGLGVSQQTIVLAVAESAGLDVRPPSGLAALLPATDVLSEREVATVLQMVRTLVDGAQHRASAAATSASAPTIRRVRPTARMRDAAAEPGPAAPSRRPRRGPTDQDRNGRA